MSKNVSAVRVKLCAVWPSAHDSECDLSPVETKILCYLQSADDENLDGVFSMLPNGTDRFKELNVLLSKDRGEAAWEDSGALD